MKHFGEILEKIENSLHFLSKNDYKNLPLIKNYESAMAKFLETMCLNDVSNNTSVKIENSLGNLRKVFRDFDSVSLEDKQKRIDLAFHHIRELQRHCFNFSAGESYDQRKIARQHLHLKDYSKELSLSVQYIKGVGSKNAQLLKKKGITSVEDMLYFLPRKYEDRRIVKDIKQAKIGERETVMGVIADVRTQRYRTRQIFEAIIQDTSGVCTAKWFKGNFTYLRKTFKAGKRIILTGEVRGYLYGKDMIHPDYELLDEDDDTLLHFKRIVPIYSETDGLHQKYVRRIMMQALDDYSHCVISPIPEAICSRMNLIDVNCAIQRVHFPDQDANIENYTAGKSSAHKRLVFDEFFFFELGMALRKRGVGFEPGIQFSIKSKYLENLYSILPFKLTAAQKKVIREIQEDMAKPFPMKRLLQGDVGSGKTIVSMVPMFLACENGYQAAIMAPTEILAEQHYKSIKKWIETIGLRAVILKGNMKATEREKALDCIKKGKANIIVGTHALIQEKVIFNNLGLIVIDEQHRFGVVQRSALRDKGANPDVLVMTATPIPRTLAMTVYGDLDISVIDELPPGREPIKTKIFYEKNREKVYRIIQKEVEKGNQVFIVYPLVEESEALDLKDATTMAEQLQQDIFPDFRIGLVHGKMKSSDKEKVMENFADKRLDILVSTTVIEVGIDIPSASLMIIEHAERFGLSQLHQLRGRVGRGKLKSYCILLARHRGAEVTQKRLNVMEQTNDGFIIAEEDLAIRGPGEMMGVRQSGLPDFRIANIIRDYKLLNDARREAFRLVTEDPSLEMPQHASLKSELLRRWKGRLELTKTG